MKKLFIVLAVASLGFVACNNEAEKTDSTDTAAKVDTPAIVAPTPDTTTSAPVDTTKKADTTVKK